MPRDRPMDPLMLRDLFPHSEEIVITNAIGKAITDLLVTGLFGTSARDVVVRLLEDRIRQLVNEGWIQL